NEFHSCNTTGDQASSVYVGAGETGGYTDFVFQNNIVREMYGEGLEINPRVTSSQAIITGNVFRNVGKGTCSTQWKCRPGITMSIQSGGGNNGTVIAGNLFFDIGSSCVWDRGGGTPRAQILNNTCFDYGKGAGGGGPNPQGISGYTNGGRATVMNNIIYAPNGTAPFDGSSFDASYNLCATGKACGSMQRGWSSNTVLSADPNSAEFMRLSESSEARNAGSGTSALETDLIGNARLQESIIDIGAFEFGVASREPASMPTPAPTLAPTPMPTPMPTPAPVPTPSPTSPPAAPSTPVPMNPPAAQPTPAPTAPPAPKLEREPGSAKRVKSSRGKHVRRELIRWWRAQQQ
ncbi:MAG TPA: choice-of-anchor Q domain-containing protein, partial [Bdellovibrionales bacterium]|nr:choice-of-anchor Q domain-containing protein [Bdellovibrionales bacterium]